MMKRRRLKALAPLLRRTRDACGNYLEREQAVEPTDSFALAAQLDEAAVKLRALLIDCPHTGESWRIEIVAQWFIFLSHLAPLAELGHLKEARGMLQKELEPRVPPTVTVVRHQLDLEPLARVGRAVGSAYRGYKRKWRAG